MNEDRQKEILNIVDENDNIIGEDTRYNIHKKGLLHREVNAWFYTSKGEIIFQKRGLNQEIYPGLLDSTAGGHVDLNEDYDSAIIREIKEETGINPEKDKLELVLKRMIKYTEKLSGLINNKCYQIYTYRFDGDINELIASEGQGFVAWPIDRLINISEKDKKNVIPEIYNTDEIKIFSNLK